MFRAATRSTFLALSIFSCFSLTGFGTDALSSAQSQAGPALLNTVNSTAAYIYVSSRSDGREVGINAYRAASDGELSLVPGSPFPTDTTFSASLAANGAHLFLTNGVDIHSYSIATDGSLQPGASIDAQGLNQSNCGGPVVLFTDRTRATLYDLDIYSDCANNAYQFFDARATGKLSYIGVTAASSPIFDVPLSFLANNQYAYGASCYHWSQEIFGFGRFSDGTLTDLNLAATMPTSRPQQFYCPYLAATDATNHLAVSMQAIDNSTLQPTGASQLATYTADSSGSLSTRSTYSNMPSTAVSTITAMSMSPSGKLLAVAGTGGVQVFHFNGTSPITPYTGLLTTGEVDGVSWDNENHLYALSQSAGKVFVFTVTVTSHSQAPRSPYAISKPENLVVVAK